MQVQETTLGSLHHRTRNLFPEALDEDTRVFVARKGNKIQGTAFAVHHNLQPTVPSGRRVRDVEIRVNARNQAAREELVTTAKSATRHLKRYTYVTDTLN